MSTVFHLVSIFSSTISISHNVNYSSCIDNMSVSTDIDESLQQCYYFFISELHALKAIACNNQYNNNG